MTRSEVYAAIDGERAYQQDKWGGDRHDSVGDWMTYMRYYLHMAEERITKENNVQGALNEMRKVAGLAVACFEQHDVPRRAP